MIDIKQNDSKDLKDLIEQLTKEGTSVIEKEINGLLLDMENITNVIKTLNKNRK